MRVSPKSIRDHAHESAVRRFHELVWPHLTMLLRVASILCNGDTSESEDLAQDAALKAFKSIDRYTDGTDIMAWLMTILRNARIDRLRSQRSHATFSLDELSVEPQAADAAQPAAWHNAQDLLEEFSDEHIIAALQQLPVDIRWTLMLVDVEGLDHQAAATILDVPVGTIKSRAHRGRSMLRTALHPIARELGFIS